MRVFLQLWYFCRREKGGALVGWVWLGWLVGGELAGAWVR